MKWTALFLVGVSFQFVLRFFQPAPVLAQNLGSQGNTCSLISNPLTPEEESYARTAWQYFSANYQPATGFANATGGYPSGTLWDLGNYIMAMNSARWLNMITQQEFDDKFNKFLGTLGQLKLFDGALPNKVYNTKTAEMVDYGNNPNPRGIGWSALDIGRMLAVLHVVRTCHPQYTDWMKGIIAKWQLTKSLKDDQLYGATVRPDKSTMLVQEGRLGYEEYAVRGYESWGFKADKALSFKPFKFVDIYGLQIPVDTRDFKDTNANNYVVSESYILDGLEFGLQGELGEYAERVLEAQKRRYQDTKQLTAVSEDNLDKPPYFIYNTVFSNGVPWAAITDENKPIPEFRSISTKAAFGWRYLYPDNEYTHKIFDAVKTLKDPKNNGFYAGLYEATQQPNKSLTGNTNGLILEILYYKARGNRPLVRGSAPVVSKPGPQPTAVASNPPAPQQPPAPSGGAVIATPIAPIGRLNPTTCPVPDKRLNVAEKRYAKVAWKYFEVYMEASGLPNDRSFIKGSSLWGLGDYLAALQAAHRLDVVNDEEFDRRVRNALGMLPKIALFTGELPNRVYHSQTMQLVDSNNKPTPEGTGWSSLDVGRLLATLYNLKTCYPQYTNSIEKIILEWSYLRVVRDSALHSAFVSKDQNGRMLTRVARETKLGYEEYAARGFQLWGFDVDKSAVGGQYQVANLEGYKVPVQRALANQQNASNRYTVSNPFLLYGLEFGLDPQMRALLVPLLNAQAKRSKDTNSLVTATTNAIEGYPHILHSSAIGQNRAWETMGEDGKTYPQERLVSTAAAIASYALFPEDPYATELWRSTLDLYNPYAGYYEGFYEKSGKTVNTYTSSTNSMILQALLFKSTDRKALIRPNANLDSPWWQAVKSGGGQGIPSKATQTAEYVAELGGSYWKSTAPAVATAIEVSLALPPPPPPPIVLPTGPDPEPPPEIKPAPVAQAPPPLRPLSPEDMAAAQIAWKFLDSHIVKKTGLVDSSDNFQWTTWWDQGSAILGLHAAKQLKLMPDAQFNQWMPTLLTTLETMPLPKTKLPNKAYSTATAQMRTLADKPDPHGTSGWSGLDVSRLLLSLHVLRQNYPEYTDRINRLVSRWDLKKLVKDGLVHGGIPDKKGELNYYQEGRLGYEQYAARSLQTWNLQAPNALSNPPIQNVVVDGISLEVDRRNFKNSGASNHLTSDPYLLWGLELGWPPPEAAQAKKLLAVQAQRFQKTNIITAVNEDAINRPPYFLYYSVHADGKNWGAINDQRKSYPQYKFASTKAAFGWSFLLPEDPYAKLLRSTFQNINNPKKGYFAGIYENPRLGKNKVLTTNTNAVILEGLLYRSRGGRPIALGK